MKNGPPSALDVGASGARNALRGYRLQLTVSLLYFLRTPDCRLQLEGEEDFVLYTAAAPPMYCQVKSGSDLSLSDLTETYIPRILARVGPKTERLLVVGSLGSELSSAWSGNENSKRKILTKLKGHFPNKTTEQLAELFTSIIPTEMDENAVDAEVIERTAALHPVGSPATTADLLLQWFNKVSEKSGELNHTQLAERIVSIRDYFSQWNAFQQEWGVSVLSLKEDDDAYLSFEELKQEFQQGVSARFEHVVAGLDAPRDSVHKAIREAFAVYRIVFLRGASGEGKSTAAYRYLLNNVSACLRFQIRDNEDFSQRQRSILGLVGHLESLNGTAYCLLDVSPGTNGWVDIVTILQARKNCKVLVCIRREDWNQAITDAQWAEPCVLDLQLIEEEAKDLFSQLNPDKAMPSFAQSWEMFGKKGPLLEYAYLLQKGELLRERLRSQVARLGSFDKKLLRRISLAGLCGATLRYPMDLEKDSLQTSVRKLEAEYLARIENRRLDALHPIRAKILSELLHDDICPIEDTAVETLPDIPAEHIEVYLLHLFLHFPASRLPVVAVLAGFSCTSWQYYASVLRAMLWLGIYQQLETNKALVVELRNRFGEAAWLPLYQHLDCGLLRPPADTLMSESLPDQLSDLRDACRSVIDQWDSAPSMHAPAKNWLDTADATRLEQPDRADGWAAYCWIAHWAKELGGTQARLAIRKNVPDEWSTQHPWLLGCDVAVCVARLLQPPERFLTSLREIYFDEMLVVRLTCKDDEVLAEYLLPSTEGLDSHRVAVRHIQVLGAIYPEADFLSAEGWGHGLDRDSPDAHRKTRVPATALAPRWSTTLNSWLIGLILLELRPQTFQSFRNQILEGQALILDTLARINEGFRKHYSPTSLLGTFRSAEDLAQLGEYIRWERRGLLLPRPLVDDYGRTHETVDFQQFDAVDQPKPLGWREYKTTKECTKPCLVAFRNYVNQLPWGLLRHAGDSLLKEYPQYEPKHSAVLAELSNLGQSERIWFLAWHNLRDFVLSLPKFQRWMRSQLGAHYSQSLFEREEVLTATIRSQVAWLYFYQLKPNFQPADLARAERFLENHQLEIKKRLKSDLQAIPALKPYLRSLSLAEGIDMDGFQCLCINVEWSEAAAIDWFCPTVFEAVGKWLKEQGEHEVASLLWPRLRIQQYYKGTEIDLGCQWLETRWAFIESTHIGKSDLYIRTRATAKCSAGLSKALRQTRELLVALRSLSGQLAIAASIDGLGAEGRGIDRRQAWASERARLASESLQQCVDHLGPMILERQYPNSASGIAAEQLRIEFLRASTEVWDLLQFNETQRPEEEDLQFLSRWQKALVGKADRVAVLCAAWVELSELT